MPVWKDSALAMLLLEVDQNIQDRAKGKMDRPDDLEDAVGNIKVDLGGDLGVRGFGVSTASEVHIKGFRG